MRRSRRSWSLIGVVALALLGIVPASNASAASCGFASVVGLSFGAYDVFGPYRLGYNIFLDATRISIWGDRAGGSVIYGPVVPLEAAPIVVPMYGRIPSGQDAHIGTYSDTIIVTMSF